MIQKKNKYVLALAGATGPVGREIVEILEERNFPVGDLLLLASEESAGERIEFRAKNWTVRELEKDSFQGVDLTIFAGDAETSSKFAPIALKAGSVVIDSSGAFSADSTVPLVVPEVNSAALRGNKGIITSPNSSTIAIASALKPIHDAAKIKRVVVTTFQSVSGSGKPALDELAQQTVALLNFRDVEAKTYPHQIAFNCLPHTGVFLDNGYSEEEVRIAGEMKRILDDESLHVTTTTVRVPVFRCDSQSVNVETVKKISANEVRALLSSAPGVMVYDDPKKNVYPLAIDTTGKDEVYVGRIREDESVPNGINLWIVCDNIRKGAALNAVQIAQLLIK